MARVDTLTFDVRFPDVAPDDVRHLTDLAETHPQHAPWALDLAQRIARMIVTATVHTDDPEPMP